MKYIILLTVLLCTTVQGQSFKQISFGFGLIHKVEDIGIGNIDISYTHEHASFIHQLSISSNPTIFPSDRKMNYYSYGVGLRRKIGIVNGISTIGPVLIDFSVNAERIKKLGIQGRMLVLLSPIEGLGKFTIGAESFGILVKSNNSYGFRGVIGYRL